MWGGLTSKITRFGIISLAFPSPLEDFLGANIGDALSNYKTLVSFPYPREDWGGLTFDSESAKKLTYVFPYPREDWGGLTNTRRSHKMV